MIEIQETRTFSTWLEALRDRRAAVIIARRLARVRVGNFGDVRPIGEGLSEFRISHGPGYRIYFAQRGSSLVILLCGGDKDLQSRDIANAKRLATEI